MPKTQDKDGRWKKSWIKPGIASVVFSAFVTILAILLLPNCKIASLGNAISEIAQQISLAIIGAMITMIAVIQAISGTAKEGSRLDQISKSPDFRAFKKNEYLNTVIAGVLLGLSIIGRLISETDSTIAIIISIFILITLAALVIIRCLKHFKLLAMLI